MYGHVAVTLPLHLPARPPTVTERYTAVTFTVTWPLHCRYIARRPALLKVFDKHPEELIRIGRAPDLRLMLNANKELKALLLTACYLLFTAYHLPLTTYHVPRTTTYHIPRTTQGTTTHCSLPTTYYVPLTTYHLPLTAHRIPRTTHCPMHYYSLLTTNYQRLTTYC